MNFSPGPWRICTGSHKDSCICGLIYGKGGEGVVAAVNVSQCQVRDHGDCAPPDEMTKGNLNLIAAAPEMYAALQAVRNYGSDGELEGGFSISYLVESALAKAASKITQDTKSTAAETKEPHKNSAEHT